MSKIEHWADALSLRPELLDAHGQITNLQMSLYAVAYRTKDVPYEAPDYYSEITEPTPGLVRFMGTVASRLGTRKHGKALFHLDQGMGGGKSHALVGLYHLASHPDEFFATEFGAQVRQEAEQQSSGGIDLSDTRLIVLSGDHMTPGKTSPEFGPAGKLHERFLWSLFRGDKQLYQEHLKAGPDKAALRKALDAAGGPVLILLDELMDYVLLLSSKEHLAGMPAEQAFLNALMDVVDDLPQVVFVVVMIRSEADERGYSEAAESVRAHVAARLERNGQTVAVTEAQDFGAIIQRRIFQPPEKPAPLKQLADRFREAADESWRQQVFDRLTNRRGLVGFADRLEKTYPFHPDLMHLVEHDWSRHAGFQHVRSTVEVFAVAAHHWATEHEKRRWAPSLIGVGDIPLAVAIEQILSSGLLHGNEKAIQGFRQVAAADVVSKDGRRGKAAELDEKLKGSLSLTQEQPAQRMATALLCYSLVPRSQGRSGATKAELLAAIYEPEDGANYSDAEEVFNALINDEEGLGALDIRTGNGGSTPTRYQLSTSQTLRMFYKQARSMATDPAERDELIWTRVRHLTKPGLFDDVLFVDVPGKEAAPRSEVFSEVDQKGRNRLVVLDPRRWTLLNGKDSQTRADILAMLGVGDEPMAVDNAASCVVACVNTQRRDTVRRRAIEALAWQHVVALDLESEQLEEAREKLTEAMDKLDSDVLRAFQHYAYLVWAGDTKVEWKRFEADERSSLKGSNIWDALVEAGRAVAQKQLRGDYLKVLLGKIKRDLSLKEINQQFYRNASFPLVSSEDDVRSAIFDLLSRHGYEAVDSAGERLTISATEELSLHSSEVILREGSSSIAEGEREEEETGTGGAAAGGTGPGGTAGGPGNAVATYKRYTITVPNRSVVDFPKRNSMWLLMGLLQRVMDPSDGPDLQLIDLQLKVTAEEGALDELRARTEELGGRWEEEEDLI